MKGSPWLEEAPRVRPEEALDDDDGADMAIVGGGNPALPPPTAC